MTYPIFTAAIQVAGESGDYEEMKHHVADTIYDVVPQGKAETAMQFLWDYATSTDVTTLVRLSGLTTSAYARQFGINLRTLQGWAYFGHSPSTYLLDLMAFATLQTILDA